MPFRAVCVRAIQIGIKICVQSARPPPTCIPYPTMRAIVPTSPTLLEVVPDQEYLSNNLCFLLCFAQPQARGLDPLWDLVDDC